VIFHYVLAFRISLLLCSQIWVHFFLSSDFLVEFSVVFSFVFLINEACMCMGFDIVAFPDFSKTLHEISDNFLI